jgi:ATP-binding cassette subfamily B protein
MNQALTMFSDEQEVCMARNPIRKVSLSRYAKPYLKYAIAAPLLMVLEVACDLMQPRFMAQIIDQGVAKGDMPFILRTGGFMLLAALFGTVGGVGCTVYATLVSQHYGADLRDDLFRKVESFSFVNMDKFSTASLITRLTNDVMQLQGIVQMMLRIMVRAPIMCVGGIVLAVAINPPLALISLSVLPFLALLLIFVIKKGFPLFTLVQERIDRLNLVVRENLTGVRVVKAFVRAEHEKKRFGLANTGLSDMTVRATRVVGTSMPLMMLVMNIGVILSVWFGGWKVHDGTLMVGEIMAMLSYVTQILFALMMSAMLLMSFSRAKVSADRVREVLSEEPDILGGGVDAGTAGCADANTSGGLEPGPISSQRGWVEFDHVSFRYAGAQGDEVLKDISFSAGPGMLVAILGATGVGKTTLVNLIPRFYDATSGTVRVHGRDVRELTLESLRTSIGMVFQESVLFSGTVSENIRRGNSQATDMMVEEAAKAAQAHDFITGFPDGYGAVIGQSGVNLSGGQKQRLSIARALLRKPSILILDDSTSAVDLGTEARFRKALSAAMRDTAVILIAQRISSVIGADRIVILDKGRISGMGTHEELMLGNAVYQEIYHSQVGEADLDMPEVNLDMPEAGMDSLKEVTTHE